MRSVSLSDNARTVLEHRYLGRNSRGEVAETPEELFARVARAVAAPDAAYGEDPARSEARFFARMAALEFLPNSPTLANAGRTSGQLAACFVLPVGDSVSEIFSALAWAAQIHTTGGGTGFSFSRLRPLGDSVASALGAAAGPLAFMDVFDKATSAVKQGGLRRGANMGVLRVDHPDILEFIHAKLESRRLTNFNLSVAMTDAFMRAVADDDAYALVNPRSGQPARSLPARQVFERCARAAWTTGDPGVLFIDRINAAQPTPEAGAIESTNPCGEQPLLPFESCVLGSLNLAKFAAGASVDFTALGKAVVDAVHFLDNVIDATVYPLPEIARVTRQNRKIGLGVMGLADLFILAGLPYDSAGALALAEEIAAFVERESVAASAELARRRGPFPAFARSRWAEGGSAPLRNATTTTVAPTGTISLIATCSSGIEPLFAVSYVRRALEGQSLEETHGIFRERMAARGLWSEGLAKTLAHRGRVRGMVEVPEDLQALFPTAHDLDPETHVRMQAAFQRHCHAAVSKTVNFPADATPDQIAHVYRRAYDLGCKGITVYRDQSRSEQVLAYGSTKDGSSECGGGTVPDGE
jgi:ribonucleoside-diphosphate reductase alpha chain